LHIFKMFCVRCGGATLFDSDVVWSSAGECLKLASGVVLLYGKDCGCCGTGHSCVEFSFMGSSFSCSTVSNLSFKSSQSKGFGAFFCSETTVAVAIGAVECKTGTDTEMGRFLC
jgi:hypothetical protein